MSTLSLTGFLGRIWPAGARYFVSCMRIDAATGKERWVNLPCDDIARAEYEIRRKAQNWNVFHTVAAFKPGATKRKHVDIQSSRCLFLDLDVARPGAVKPNAYPDQRSALAAAITAWRAAQLPDPNLYLSSGWGVHVYWILDTDLNPTQWQPLADGLRAEMERHGVHFDGSVTTTMARLLRPPETFNIKDPANRKPVHCFYHENNSVPLSAVQHLASVQPIPRLARPGKGRGPSLNAGITTMNYDPSASEGVRTRCGVLRQMFLTQSSCGQFDDRDLWLAMLATMANTVDAQSDGKASALHMSARHHAFNAAIFEQQWDNTVANKIPPGLCSTFAKTRADICGQCPYANVVVTPLSLGTARFANAPAPPVSGPLGTVLQLGASQAPPPVEPLPVPPYGFFPDNTGWRIMRPDAEDPRSAVPVLLGRVLKIQYRMHEGLAELTMVYQASPGSLARPVIMRLGRMSEKNDAYFSGLGLSVVNPREATFMFRTWQHELQSAANGVATVDVDRGLGWTTEGRFMLGDRLYSPNGKVETLVASHELADVYKMCGDFDKWQPAAQCQLDAFSMPLVAAMAASFASPLVELSDVPGSRLLSLVSTNTGTGKSTAAELEQSIWGTPGGMVRLNATNYSASERAGQCGNVPLIWDEVRGAQSDDAAIISIFQMADGHGRMRLRSAGGNVGLQLPRHHRNTIVLHTNTSIRDRAKVHDGTPDGVEGPSTARLFEMFVPDIVNLTPKLGEAGTQSRVNCGHAGHRFVQFLVQERATVAQWLSDMEREVRANLTDKTAYRIHVSTIALAIMGAHLATRYGILRFDVSKLTAYLFDAWKRMTSSADGVYLPLTSDNEALAMTALDGALSALLPRTIVTVAGQRAPGSLGRAATAEVIKPPRGNVRDDEHGVAVEWIVNKNLLMIEAKELHAWLVKTKRHKSTTLRLFEQYFGMVKDQRALAAGTSYHRLRLMVYVFDCTKHPELQSKVAGFGMASLQQAGVSLTMPSVH